MDGIKNICHAGDFYLEKQNKLIFKVSIEWANENFQFNANLL